MQAHMCHSKWVEVIGQLAGVGSVKWVPEITFLPSGLAESTSVTHLLPQYLVFTCICGIESGTSCLQGKLCAD